MKLIKTKYKKKNKSEVLQRNIEKMEDNELNDIFKLEKGKN